MINANLHSAVNLVFNGGFELKLDNLAPFWTFSGFDASNSYELGSTLKLILDSGVTATISQDFASELLPRDKNQPVVLRTFRNGPEGYKTTENRVVPSNTPYTLAISVNKDVGNLIVKPFVVTSAKTYLDEQLVTVSDKIRLVFQIPAQNELINEVGFEFLSPTAGIFEVDKVSMIPGSYSELPYLGDPFQQVFPADCVVMTMGDACPTGFEPYDTSTKGKLVRNSENTGSATHTADSPTVELEASDKVSYEGREGRLYDEHTRTPTETPSPVVFNVSNENPLCDEAGEHTHTIEPGGSVPVSLGFTFCKRV